MLTNIFLLFKNDYLDIHKGFPKKLTDGNDRQHRTELDIKIQNLYDTATISDTNFEILDNGFKYPRFKSDFPKLLKPATKYIKQAYLNDQIQWNFKKFLTK